VAASWRSSSSAAAARTLALHPTIHLRPQPAISFLRIPGNLDVYQIASRDGIHGGALSLRKATPGTARLIPSHVLATPKRLERARALPDEATS
jgi:hypothetical protein